MTEEQQDKIVRIFFPNFACQRDRVQELGKRFVHYTSAEAAMHILRNKEIWLRNAAIMNDFMEVEHGFNCLNETYKGDIGQEFKTLLEEVSPGLSQEVEQHFNALLGHIRHDTFMLCVSEHEDLENGRGRLSMWRGYGASDSVAFVMNTPVFFGEADDLKAFTSPVAYLDNGQFAEEFRKIVHGIKNEVSFLQSLDRNIILNLVVQMFRYASVCTKHPGFSEEKEWRVIYSPNIEPSAHIEKSYQVLRGTPQMVHKIPLKDIPEINFHGAAPASLVDRIIIGPSQYPMVMYDTFVKLLEDAGVKKAPEKVIVSDIPLRR